LDFPLQFLFLPVHQLAVLLKVPISQLKTYEQCIPSCIHGQCFSYVNTQSLTFCHCDSGIQCNIKSTCNCSLNSLCIRHSICVCPIGRFGPHCYLSQFSCHVEICANNGKCIVSDERYSSKHLSKLKCICPQKYWGDHCEYHQTRIDISFHWYWFIWLQFKKMLNLFEQLLWKKFHLIKNQFHFIRLCYI
jgi:hypothetical protein